MNRSLTTGVIICNE